jgi:WD40 repeat protein
MLMEIGDITTGRVERRVRVGKAFADVHAATVSDDGARLAIMKWGDDARGPDTWEQRAVFEVWDTRTGRLLRRLLGETTVIYTALALSPDGKRLAAGGQKGILDLWDVASGAASALHTGHGEQDVRVLSIAFSPDGKRFG